MTSKDVEQFLHEWDMAELEAKHKHLLQERLRPLLMDAIDALEIEPPALKTALSRIRAVVAAIDAAS